MCQLDWTALFTGIYTLLTAILAWFGFTTYSASQQQRKLENGLKLIDLFYKTMTEEKFVRRSSGPYGTGKQTLDRLEILKRLIDLSNPAGEI